MGGRDSIAPHHSLLIPITLPIFYDNTPFITQVFVRLGLSTPSVSCQALLNTVDIFIIFAFHFRTVLSQVTKRRVIKRGVGPECGTFYGSVEVLLQETSGLKK